MPLALLNIGASGAAVSRASLELTAQNIANASNPNYARRTLGQSELVGSATIGLNSADSLGGVRIGGVNRSGSELVQLQARNATSDLERTEALLTGLQNSETAIEQSQLFGSLVNFEAALVRLESDPTDATLRTTTLENARQLANTFQLADRSLSDARGLMQSDLTAQVSSVQTDLDELARVNADIVAARDGSAGLASLLDARDKALRGISEELSISVSFSAKGAAEVQLAGSPAETLVSGPTASTFTASLAPDGTASFAVDGTAVALDSGAMAGRAQALQEQADLQIELDAIAGQVITSANAAQASGVDINAAAGQPMFAGSDAGDIALALTSGAQFVSAPAGSPAGSRDTSVLAGLISTIGDSSGPIQSTDTLLLGLSSRTAGVETRREGLTIVSQAAEAQLLAETGVNLDTEAADLVRLQQSFEANGRVIQVALQVFDTLLGLR